MRYLSLCVVLCFTSFCSGENPPYSKRGWLPKAETGALRLLEQHPTYDGRGVVVAIFDTGVDPGVDGLKVTSDGRPKIIDMVDGSGSGDVDTSTVVQADEGKLLGLSGRTLTIPKKWKNPSGDFRVGLKRAYELFPADLIRRVKTERRKHWDREQRRLMASERDALLAWDQANPTPDDAQKKVRAELERRIALLAQVEAGFDDPGPIYDCVVFHDGTRWQAAIDTDEDGDLGDEKVMTNYRVRRQFATFDEVSLLNFAVNIYDSGDLLSIVTDCGTHGTHVAGIVAANYPDHPERNGIAPGAQIVSVKIGDRRLGSSSTGVGQVRGLTAVLRNRCDLINMSYGGATGFPNQGRLLERYAEVIHEHGVLFVASAGNNGPALSTVGSPGGVSSALLGVGAYVSPDLMTKAYAQRQPRDEMPFTWTSRGPAADGALGVDICAPGGAISPVSRWSLQHRRLANGTSMSSPNACGNLALIMSGLKKEKVKYTPTSVRRAVINTARPLKAMDPFAHGQGLIQADRALDYAIAHRQAPYRDARFEVRFPDRQDDRGLYLRDADETDHPLSANVSVRPRYADRDANASDRSAVDLVVQLKSSADWVKAPSQLVMTHGGKTFEVVVDPTKLPAGAHHAEVCGFDANQTDAGPLFRIPITVVRRHATSKRSFEATAKLNAGDESRYFLQPPGGATWVDVALTASARNAEPERFVLHALQPEPDRGYGRGFQREYITLRPGESVLRSFPIRDDLTLELCLGQYWASVGEANRVTLQTRFHGITPEPTELSILSDQPAARVDVRATLGDQWIEPEVWLDTLRRWVTPSNFELRPVAGGRDQLPNERRMYESITTYAFAVDSETEVRPRPLVSRVPNASMHWESRLWQLFDENKRLIASGTGGEAKVAKGEYTLRLHVRHEDPAELERWKAAAIMIDQTLAKPIAIRSFAGPQESIAGKQAWRPLQLAARDRTVFYLGAIAAPKNAQPGDLLLGRFHLGSKSKAVASAGRRPNGFPVQVRVAPQAAAEKSKPSSMDGANEQESERDFLLEAQRAELARLRAAGDHDAHAALVKTILESHPKDIDTLVERLHMLDDDDRKKRLPEVVAAADAIARRVNTKRLAQQLGVRVDAENPEQVQARKAAEQQRERLVDALYRKGRAVAYMDLPPTPGAPPMVIRKKPKKREAREKLFESNYQQLARWVDMNEPKYVLLKIRRDRRQGRPAAALESLEKLLKEQPTRELLYKKRADIFGELGWDQWRNYQLSWKIIRFPKAFPPF